MPSLTSELELTLGEVAGTVGDAEQSVTYADRSGDAFQRLARRANHADVLHQAGRRAEAETCFREAEQLQQERQPDYPLLYSLQGFNYCDLLLAAPERAAWQLMFWTAGGPRPQHVAGSQSRDNSMSSFAGETAATGDRSRSELLDACRAVSQRASQTLKWISECGRDVLSPSLDHLTLGRAALYEAILERSAAVSTGPAAATPDASHAEDSPSAFFPANAAAGGATPTPALQALKTARRELDAAVSGLRRANRSDYLPRALLTRAWLRYLTGACTGPESAQTDLDEAWEIAERGPMRLFLADIHLYRARLFGRSHWSLVAGHPPLAEASGVTTKDQGTVTKDYPWESPAADLAAARRLIEQCGYWRRKEELEDADAARL